MIIKEKYLILAGYVLALLVFFFLGMKKPTWPETFIAFAVVSAFYVLAVWFVKRFIVK